MIGPPVTEVAVGHASVTAIRGIVMMGQVAVTELETVLPVHLSLPLATNVSATEQEFRGAV